MPLVKYRIYELSARAVISYGRQQDGTYTFHLSAAETEKCKSLSAPHEQDDTSVCPKVVGNLPPLGPVLNIPLQPADPVFEFRVVCL